MTRQIGPKALALIKASEGLRLKAYKCPADVVTIGHGSTGPHVKMGMVITDAEAEALLRQDLSRFEAAVNAAAPNATIGQHGAMVSLAFNVGIGAFNRSSVLSRHKAGDFAGAANAFALWNKAGGRVMSGLVTRRAAEAALYRGDA